MNKPTLSKLIKELAKKYLPETIAIRRHLHEYPELSFEEYQTSTYIQNKLKEYNIPFKANIAETGVVALIEGKNPNKTCIALRADIDALPIQEQNNVSYRSKNAGVMHACGHDAHTAIMLTVTKILYELRQEFEGSIKIIFQPGEEKIPGGASLMINEGVLENPKVEKIIAQHVMPGMPTGTVGFRKGAYMASTDEIYITLKGKGGHGAMPHELADTVLMSAYLITNLQQVVSRNINPIVPSVLSFGKIIGEGATNIIPNQVYLEGTFRTFDEKWRQIAHEKITKIAKATCESMGGNCDIEIVKGFPALNNDPQLTETCIFASQEFLGKEKVLELEMRSTGEDFAFYSQKIPSCFYRFGITNPMEQTFRNVHTSTFDIDEQALETAVGNMVYVAINATL